VAAPGSLEDGACAAGEATAGSGAAPEGTDDEDSKIRVNSPGSPDAFGAAEGGATGEVDAAAGATDEEDWKSRVNSPGSPEPDFCGVEAETDAGAGDDGVCGVPLRALNICVKLLGDSESCSDACAGTEAAGVGALSAGADAGFSMETWRKTFAIPALGLPGVLMVCSILVNSPGADEARTAGAFAGEGVGAGAAGAAAAGSADGRSRDASSSSSDAWAGVSFT
jgi:hypothetical protein